MRIKGVRGLLKNPALTRKCVLCHREERSDEALFPLARE